MVAYVYAPKRYLHQSRGVKGHEDLIDALAICRTVNPAIQGVFVGGPWHFAEKYTEQVEAYGRERLGNAAHFLGTRMDIAELYADFDVAVHPSHSENLGGAAESQLLGVPTIATNVGGFPDIVVPNATGWLVPPKDPPALASAIRDALSDPQRARTFADEGQKRATAMLDARSTARDILPIYANVTARTGR
jgi:glycosyltransferase involved in cell wall biosynthesis